MGSARSPAARCGCWAFIFRHIPRAAGQITSHAVSASCLCTARRSTGSAGGSPSVASRWSRCRCTSLAARSRWNLHWPAASGPMTNGTTWPSGMRPGRWTVHSGHGADAPGLSNRGWAAEIIAAARRLPVGGLRLVAALLAVAILALSLIGGCAAEPSAEPTVRNFLLAWEQGRYNDAAAYTTGAPHLVAAALRGEYQQVGAAAVFLNMGNISVHGDHADARFHVSVDLGQDGAPWRYQGEFALRRVGTDWKIEWRPSVINPHLRAGLRFAAITRMPDRAPVLDSGGRPLVRLSAAYELGVRPNRLAHPRATAAKFAAVTGLDPDQVLSQIRSAQPNRFLELLTLSPAAYS